MNNLNFQIGMTAPEVVIEIVKLHPTIKFLYFHIYTPRETVGDAPLSLPLTRLLYHDPSLGGKIIKVKRSKILSGNLGAILPPSKEDAVGVLSKVRCELTFGSAARDFHIPLMDFRCQNSTENLQKVKEFLSEVGQKRGVILWSGRSFHYYGADLMSNKEWLRFLGECLLFTGFADERYIGHRLLDGCGILRIAAGGTKPMPQVISIL